MKYIKLYVFLFVLVTVFLAAVFFIKISARFDKAPHGENWEDYLREKRIIEQGSTNIRIENKREISSDVISLDVYEELPSGLTRYSMAYVDMNSGEVTTIVSYVTTDEEKSDVLHDE